MKTKSKTIDGDAAFKAVVGKTIITINKFDNSIEIHFVDKSFINIELKSTGGCTGHGDDEYCYCSPSEVEADPYFHP